ncbi:MAG: TonB-dependent receptor [Bacteroidota bacterium]|jgi:TonB-linked SusC/RagA family outer membrane protein|nr:MAG: SusC/RagA family TonB-linked outer membrane protein [Bacteroidota bacterium]
MKKNVLFKDFVWRFMKLGVAPILIITAFASIVNATSLRGQEILDTRISLKAERMEISKILLEIERQADCHFTYQGSEIDAEKRVTLLATNEDLRSVLRKLFKNTIRFHVIENEIILIPSGQAWQRNESVPEKNIPAIGALSLQVSGVVTTSQGEPLPGVNVLEKNTVNGTTTDANGEYSLVVRDENAVLIFSFIGFVTQEVPLQGRSQVNVELAEDVQSLSEVVVVGYGEQKKSDITGSIASLPKERLEMVPNTTVAQALQGSIPGVMVMNTGAGAEPNMEIMIRGRNSIAANNAPLVVVDGIPYGGNLTDLNPADIESIEVLKDGSAAAIYGSRGANGVILITTKQGIEGPPTISYDGYFSVQEFTNMPTYLDGPGFYEFKNQRLVSGVTASERAVYESGEWVNWPELATRQGLAQQHNLSLSGGFGRTSYFISGGLMDVRGIVINDDFFRATGRFNLDSRVTDWLTVGTRTQLTYTDKSGVSPDMWNVFLANPLSTPYNEDGTLTIIPSADDPARGNSLQETLYKNDDGSTRIVANFFAAIDFEKVVPGLEFRFNYGLTDKSSHDNTYMGRDTYNGMVAQGRAILNNIADNSSVVENILSYKKELGSHSLFATALFSVQKDKFTSQTVEMAGFPNDLLTWYAGGQAGFTQTSFDYTESTLASWMFRLNYSYDSRFLLTLTGRRDGYSGFGAATKWGTFPSVAVGWNIVYEEFFPWKDLFTEFKLRGSYGLNGNQAVGSYQSMGRLAEENNLAGNTTMPGYFPSTLGQPDLGWETSKSLNIGLDFGILDNRITGDINVFSTDTQDLLLYRSISMVHGITSILQNIGKVANRGVEFSVHSRNIVAKDFSWTTSGNISYVKNKIVDLYGDGLDDVANAWFIGKPIRVNYDYVFDGVWQLSEAATAAEWGTEPGFIKIKDINSDNKITPDDRQIIGQQDPKMLWGLTNMFTYRNFSLTVFVHGVHGVTKENVLMDDEIVTAGVRRNTIVKNWWTPDNPSNEWYKNHLNAHLMSGVTAPIYEDASFVRLKDVTLSYDLPLDLIQKFGGKKFRVYATGRNLVTWTSWRGLDPELEDQRSIPLQREYVLGLQIGL